MTIMAEAPDTTRETSVMEDRPGSLANQRAVASALIGLLGMNLPTVSWTVYDSGTCDQLSGHITRTWRDAKGNLRDDDVLALEATQVWADHWHIPIKLRHPLTETDETAYFEIQFEYRGVKVDIYLPLTDRVVIARALS